uniref:Uncharacterized protein n=1 Tax=Triticum urartu TaxID=4572 RepID=A0A8R7UUS8_TRIUA
MDSFSSPSMSSSGSSPNPEALMEQIKAQLAQAYAQELLEGLTASNFAHKQLILVGVIRSSTLSLLT